MSYERQRAGRVYCARCGADLDESDRLRAELVDLRGGLEQCERDLDAERAARAEAEAKVESLRRCLAGEHDPNDYGVFCVQCGRVMP